MISTPRGKPVPRPLFKQRVGRWATKIGVQPKRVYVQAMRNKWASCSTAGRVYFSADLLSQPVSFQDQVIAHELLHLLIPNHGALFKSFMNAYLPQSHATRAKHIACSRPTKA
ncbi:MAG: M48 family metallopeptidase [Elusimicrobia bacterium]|nr:M48 family metallopeptidase [Elusimicrobiota bacterium]